MAILDLVKKFGPKAVPIVVALLVGIGAGWFAKPDVVKVEEKLKVVEVVKEVVVQHETVRVEVVRVKDTQVVERWHREKTETKTPDGTVVTKEVEDKNIDSIIKEKENSTEVKIVEVIKEVVVEKEVIKEKVVTPMLAQWHLGVLVGTAPRFDSPTDTPLLIGVEAERRILGPVWLGAWGMAGSPVVGGFKVVNASLGLKVGFEF